MTIQIKPRHWLVFAVLLATQGFGLVLTLLRGNVLSPGWLYFGLFAIRQGVISVIFLSIYVVSLCAVTSVLIVTLLDRTARHS